MLISSNPLLQELHVNWTPLHLSQFFSTVEHAKRQVPLRAKLWPSMHPVQVTPSEQDVQLAGQALQEAELR